MGWLLGEGELVKKVAFTQKLGEVFDPNDCSFNVNRLVVLVSGGNPVAAALIAVACFDFPIALIAGILGGCLGIC